MRLPLAVTVPPALALGGLCVFAVRLAVEAQRAQVATGVEGLTGEIGDVTRDLDPEGRVFVHGESWTAVSSSGPIPRGAKVRVLKVDQLKLTVEPAGDVPG
jgi:membrane-bound serine protease (ClpP class)